GLSAWETIGLYVLIPVGLFVVIAGLVMVPDRRPRPGPEVRQLFGADEPERDLSSTITRPAMTTNRPTGIST
ncbi:hypothetical protein AB0N47_18555, partial [Streptomyces griseoluteus]